MAGISLLGGEKSVICNKACQTMGGRWVAGQTPGLYRNNFLAICKKGSFCLEGPNIFITTEQTPKVACGCRLLGLWLYLMTPSIRGFQPAGL